MRRAGGRFGLGCAGRKGDTHTAHHPGRCANVWPQNVRHAACRCSTAPCPTAPRALATLATRCERGAAPAALEQHQPRSAARVPSIQQQVVVKSTEGYTVQTVEPIQFSELVAPLVPQRPKKEGPRQVHRRAAACGSLRRASAAASLTAASRDLASRPAAASRRAIMRAAIASASAECSRAAPTWRARLLSSRRCIVRGRSRAPSL